MVRFVAFADETVFGTPVTPPTDFLSAIRCNLHPEREPISIQSMAILGHEDARVGSYKIVGDIELVPSSENMLKLIKWLMGDDLTTTDDGSSHYKHVWDPSSSLLFGTTYLFPEIGISPTDQAIQFTSTIPLSLRIEGALNAAASCIYSMLGQVDKKVDAPTLGTLPTIGQFFSIDAIVESPVASDISAKVDSLSLTIARAVPDDFYAMTDHLLKGFLGGNFTVEGSLDLLFSDFDMLEDFWGGATGPIKKPAETSLLVKFVGPALGGVDPFDFHKLEIQLPAIILSSSEQPVEQQNKIIQTVPFQAKRGTIDSETHVMRLTIYNSIAAP